MPIMQDSVAVGAGATNSNVLSGKQLRRIPLDTAAVIRVFDDGSATGLTRSFSVNNVNEVEEGLVGATNRIPQKEDQVADNVVAGPGAELQLKVSNPTAGALTYFYRVEIDEIPPEQLA